MGGGDHPEPLMDFPFAFSEKVPGCLPVARKAIAALDKAVEVGQFASYGGYLSNRET